VGSSSLGGAEKVDWICGEPESCMVTLASQLFSHVSDAGSLETQYFVEIVEAVTPHTTSYQRQQNRTLDSLHQ